MKGIIYDIINKTSIAHKQPSSSILGYSSKLLAFACMGILFLLRYLSQDQHFHFNCFGKASITCFCSISRNSLLHHIYFPLRLPANIKHGQKLCDIFKIFHFLQKKKKQKKNLEQKAK